MGLGGVVSSLQQGLAKASQLTQAPGLGPKPFLSLLNSQLEKEHNAFPYPALLS